MPLEKPPILSESDELAALRSEVAALRDRVQTLEDSREDRVALVVFSGDMDKMLAAFVIATGAASLGMEVSMFFTFWGLAALKKTVRYSGKTSAGKLMALMLPKGPHSVGPSKLNMMGMGKVFFQAVMKQKKVASLPELIALAQELGVKLTACQMSMDVMGIQRDELLDDLEIAGAATYVEEASRSRVTLFI